MSHITAGVKGRGACSNEKVRFEQWQREAVHEDVGDEGEVVAPAKTSVVIQTAKSIISRNRSPDVPFDASINPIQGCEHGCVYCFARPTHAYLGLSPGLDFETKLFAKQNAAELLRAEFEKRSYVPEVITVGANTDPYQPAEKTLQITRALLGVFEDYNHPVSIITKSGLVMRDIDILSRLAEKQLVKVHVSVTSLDAKLSRTLEPRASAPRRRLLAIERLTDAQIPVGVLVAPVIPAITDHELESIVRAVATAGAKSAGYVLLRLPHEVAGLFTEWLDEHYPLKSKHVQTLLSQMRGGALYDAKFGERMSGTGPYADLLRDRFRLACKKHQLNLQRVSLRTDLFKVPHRGPQLALF
ncbi:PA0069 family radical SAM protein [Rugamonas sp.]|uniref:PA0069 family radical SAM protein n=1 Tax=Rugamonas sp. TaxID=1926287 RepID=UPI0025E0D303|nr:PA0069 family radical SAM protein [Rugamonas sp.]